MSLLNILLRSTTRADVYVDTLAADLDHGVRAHISKLFVASHIHAVVAGRGLAHTLLCVGGLSALATSLEEMCDAMPSWIAHNERQKASAIPSSRTRRQLTSNAAHRAERKENRRSGGIVWRNIFSLPPSLEPAHTADPFIHFTAAACSSEMPAVLRKAGSTAAMTSAARLACALIECRASCRTRGLACLSCATA